MRRGQQVRRIFDTVDDLSANLAEYVVNISERSIRDRGSFAVAISGARALVGFLGKLCEAPYDKTVEWERWYVFMADELAADEFLAKFPVLHGHVISPFINVDAGAGVCNSAELEEEAAAKYEFAVRQLVKSRVVDVCEPSDCPKFDLVILSVPAAVAANDVGVGGNWLAAVGSTSSSMERIAFTIPVINSASNVAVVAADDREAALAQLAAAGVDVEIAGGRVVWFLDSSASTGLGLHDQYFEKKEDWS